VIDVQAISEFARPQDLAFYVVICTLKSLNRSDIKNTIMQASGFKTLMERSSSSGNLEDVLENFLNGHYMDFQRQIAQIMSQMSFDMYLGGSKINNLMNDIRRKGLIQYVAPYKVIDLREIAKAFDLSVEQVEHEIAHLIVTKQIQAKIDSHSKLLYSRKDNETLNSYKEAVALGTKFIQETEAALLRVQIIQKGK